MGNETKQIEDTSVVEGKRKRDIRTMYLLMSCMVIFWGFDYVVAKEALELLPPLTLLFLKYGVGAFLLIAVKLKTDFRRVVRKKDIPLFILCSIFGEILYYLCEYTAMDYIPISLITIVLAFVPALSIITEKVLFKKNTTRVVVIGVVACIFGVALVIGMDFGQLMQGRLVGYLLAFGAVLSWNIYNFLTTSLHERYTSITLTCTQLTCTALLLMPYAIHTMPPIQSFTPAIIGGIIYLGVLSAGVGVLIMVRALHVLGPTPAALFSNFLPVTSTFFGWFLLHESISGMQIIGGIIVIASACVVIKEKEKLETESK